jgi:hypothetical protein
MEQDGLGAPTGNNILSSTSSITNNLANYDKG